MLYTTRGLRLRISFCVLLFPLFFFFFFFNDRPPPEFSPLPLPAPLRICPPPPRVGEPRGRVLRPGVWSRVARGAGRGEPHVYRLSRVVAAARLEAAFTRPADFDLAAFWAGWARAFAAGLPRIGVRVRLAPDALEAARSSAIDVE